MVLQYNIPIKLYNDVYSIFIFFIYDSKYLLNI